MLVGDQHRLAGIIKKQPFAWCVGLTHRQRQALAPVPVVPTESAVLVASAGKLREDTIRPQRHTKQPTAKYYAEKIELKSL